jgi:hypothetical protein
MAVNIDEGEPGTFKDRTYLERDPHRFLEGVLIAAQVVGIELRLHLPARRIPRVPRHPGSRPLADLQAAPAVPELPNIELRRGAGAYICGEESAMLESIEGKRGEPRLRPPYIAQVGLFGRPTLEHNFETLYWVRDIVARGAGLVRRTGPPWPAGTAQFQRQRPRQAARREAGAGRHHAARADRRILRRHGRGARAVRLPAGRAPRAASCRRGWPMCRWTSTPCSRTAASSAAAASSCSASTTARATRR